MSLNSSLKTLLTLCGELKIALEHSATLVSACLGSMRTFRGIMLRLKARKQRRSTSIYSHICNQSEKEVMQFSARNVGRRPMLLGTTEGSLTGLLPHQMLALQFTALTRPLPLNPGQLTHLYKRPKLELRF